MKKVEGKKTISTLHKVFSIHKKNTLFIFVVFSIFLISINVNAVRITPGTTFTVGNQTFTVYEPMDFHTITIAPSYIIFNTTGFFVSSGNPITISLVYLNNNIVGANNGAKILEFYATTPSGSVLFEISGFPVGARYNVKRDGTDIALVTADNSGFISFQNAQWSTKLFEIFQHSSAPSDTTPPEISEVTLIHSQIIDTEAGFGWENISCTVTDNVAVDQVFLRIINPDSTITNTSMFVITNSNRYYVNTTLQQHGNYSYSIWANDTNGNSCSSSNYLYSKPPNWDINMDGWCTVYDFVLISNRFGETGSPGWIREDVDNNGIIQVFDMVRLSSYYDMSWWV